MAAPLTISAADFLPAKKSLTALREAAVGCEGCDLYKNATQTVFGEGPKAAPIMVIGETPGDQEDVAGRPFVGPAGKLLDQALSQTGIVRNMIYVTNAVKHFRFDQHGPRRLHKKPTWREVRACRPWLENEIAVIKPQVIVCLGATAAQSLLGADFRITAMRGQLIPSDFASAVIATYHPSAILRTPDAAARAKMRTELLDDLKLALQQLK